MKNVEKHNKALELYDQVLASENTKSKSRILKQKSWAYQNIGGIYMFQALS